MKAFSPIVLILPLLLDSQSLKHTAKASSSSLSAITISDDFDNADGTSSGKTGSDGSASWTTNWSGQASNGVTFPSNCFSGSNCLTLTSSDTSTASSKRKADLSSAVSASLSFNYELVASPTLSGSKGLLHFHDGTSWTKFADIHSATSAFMTVGIPSTYFNSNFQVRFRTKKGAIMEVDEVEIHMDVASDPPAVIETLADNFDSGSSSTNLNGNDGSIAFAAPWTTETGVFVMQMSGWCASNNCLRLLTSGSSFVTSYRLADLSAFNSASLRFDFRVRLNDGSVSVSVGTSSGGTYQLDSLVEESAVSTREYAIPSAYLQSDFYVMFQIWGNEWNDLYIDNIELTVEGGGGGAPTPPTPTPPTPTPPTPTPPTPTLPAPSPPNPTGSSLSSGCGRTNRRVNQFYDRVFSSGRYRNFYVSVPSNYDRNRGYGFIFGVHGFNYTGVLMRDYMRLETTGEQNDYIFVYPDGERRDWPCYYTDQVTGWSLGQRDNNVDFIMFDDILEYMEDEYCIDTAKVYLTGQSWGGDYTSSLPCSRGNKIAAAVSIAAFTDHYFEGFPGRPNAQNFPIIQPSDCQRPVPMLTMEGLGDTRMFSYQLADWWYEVNQCTAKAPNAPFDKNTITWVATFEDQGCAAPNIYKTYTNRNSVGYRYQNFDHQIPIDFEYTAMDFFRQFTL